MSSEMPESLREDDQYIGCVLPAAVPTHSDAVYDPRVSPLIVRLGGGSGCVRGYSRRYRGQHGSFVRNIANTINASLS